MKASYRKVPIAILLGKASLAAAQDSICISASNTFTVIVDLYASELGYFTFEECGDMVNPTIGIEIGQNYTFVQKDRSNYFHPLGFAYFPDGAHNGVDELEPGVGPPGTDGSCEGDLTCPAPMYFLNGEYLGKYSNIASVAPITTGEGDFGLDAYEPLFFHPLPEWNGYGEFTIKLNFDQDYGRDIFYFCHIHQFMSGRIKLLRDGQPVASRNRPRLGYKYDQPGPFDRECGTFGLDDFQLPHPECPSEFVCDAATENQAFANCIDATNCHMFVGMTTKVSSRSEIALFVHQMIPHHQNAVNMAKSLLLKGDIQCNDLQVEDPICEMELILRDMINTQNFQIQGMRRILEDLNLPPDDDCTVAIRSGRVSDGAAPPSSKTQGGKTGKGRGGRTGMMRMHRQADK